MKDNQLLQSGVSPKCGSNEVYTDKNLPNRGYFEEYIPEEELKNQKTMDKLKSKWEKL